MFTRNNFVLCRGERFGDPYKKVPLDKLKETDNPIAVQLPGCNISFPVEIDSIDRWQAPPGTLAYRLVLQNTMDHIYEVEVTPSDKEAFCRFSKFKKLENIVQWFQNFALVDWRGFPCKIWEAKPIEYSGPIFDISVKDTNNLNISGLIFRSFSYDEDGYVTNGDAPPQE